jgi:flavin reductase (DIM6/NTAB) family NADH-FMN oxidoreductase RutF
MSTIIVSPTARPRPIITAENRPLAAAGTITIPTIFIRGGLSRLDAARDAEAFTARLAQGEYVEVDDASFVAADDRVETFNGLLLDFLERRQPRGPIEFRAGADHRTLRDALGCFATGVTVVTAIAPDGSPVGLTANSFTSLSLDPPLLLVCIANTSGNARTLREAEHFGLNVLQIGQQPVSQRFAGRGEDRFAQTAWEQGETGVPILAGALSAFECRRHAVHEGGDHFILVGQVLRAQFEPRRDPLLYFRGKYRRLHFV